MRTIEEVIAELRNDIHSDVYLDEILEIYKAERPTGHWIIEECSLGKTYYCSECYAHPEVCFDFCPYCGADMRGDKE